MVTVKYRIGDARKLFDEVESGSIRMIVTSPPYNLRKDYGTYTDDMQIVEWETLIDEIAKASHRVLTTDGSFFMNVSPIPNNKTKEIIPLNAIVWNIMKKNGYYLRNHIIWHFNNMQNCINRLSGRWEAVLWFVKDIDHYVFNLEDVKVPVLSKNDKRFDASTDSNYITYPIKRI